MSGSKRRLGSVHKLQPDKKRKKRDHPKVENYLAMASLSSALAKITQQEQQFIALLKQVCEITEHDAAHPEKQWFTPDFEFHSAVIAEISSYIQQWLSEIVQKADDIQANRDQALSHLRQVDVLDNDALKGAALTLTEYETQYAVIQQIRGRWAKIVRHKPGTDIQKHTQEWLKRWLAQWKKIHQTLTQRVSQLKEVLKSPLFKEEYTKLE